MLFDIQCDKKSADEENYSIMSLLFVNMSWPANTTTKAIMSANFSHSHAMFHEVACAVLSFHDENLMCT